MPQVAIVATITVKPGRLEHVLSCISRHRARCLRDEPGTLLFEMMVPNDHPDTIMLYEVYTDRPAFDVHWNGPSIAVYRQETDGIADITGAIWGEPRT